MKVAGALLAAGASRRFGGKPKALLEFRDSTFLAGLTWELKEATSPTLVVVSPGAASQSAAAISGSGAKLVMNRSAERGMGSSIATAVRALEHFAPDADALLVALVDQPLVDRALFAQLVAAAGDGGWAACDYGEGVVGPPTLFPRSAFAALAELEGDHGARPLVEQHADRLALVPFPGGRTDIDTPADYEALLAEEAKLAEALAAVEDGADAQVAVADDAEEG